MTIPITYFRSSSFNGYDFCPHKYYLDFILNLKSKPVNNKAEKGCITHKALEMLAQRKLAEQNSEPSFFNDELAREYKVEELTPDKAIFDAYDFYTNKKNYDYNDIDLVHCIKWMNFVLEYANGRFNPLKRNVVLPEQYFDITIEEPWAKYSYKSPDGKKIDGYLAIKGTLDLVTRRKPDIIEYIDWKTGAYANKDINTGKMKGWEDFRYDPQMMIYYYALTKLYPQDEVFMVIFLIQNGGPHSLYFDRSDIPRIENMLRERFEKIKNCVRPRLIYPHAFKCKRLCHFCYHDFAGNKVDYEQGICNTIKNEILTLGIDRVTAKYNPNYITNQYGEGGGLTHDKPTT